MNNTEQWIIQIVYDTQESEDGVISKEISEEIGISHYAVNGHISILQKRKLIYSISRSGQTILRLTEKGVKVAENIYGGTYHEAMD